MSVLIAGLLFGPLARATEPWLLEPPREPEQHRFGQNDLAVRALYRASLVSVRSLALSGDGPKHASFLEHQVRAGAEFDHEARVRLVLSVEPVHGALWTDNSSFTRGDGTGRVAWASTRVGYRGTGDPRDPASYGLVTSVSPEPMWRRAYGELRTDIGLFRIGRQEVFGGESIYAATGEPRSARFGQVGSGDHVDRALFVTKPLEAFVPTELRNQPEDQGLLAGVFFDRLGDRDPQRTSDDGNNVGLAVRYRERRPDLRQEWDLMAVVAQRWSDGQDGSITLLATRAVSSIWRFGTGFEVVSEFGRASSGQKVQRLGARGVVRWDEPAYTLYLELDFASGDDDPSASSRSTRFTFSPDTNVGLLLFDRVLAFSSARSAAAALIDPERPPTPITTDGAFTNALAVFPQFDLRIVPGFSSRSGVLLAWAPSAVVDPWRSGYSAARAEQRNFHGGRPDNFYGVELDQRFTYEAYERVFVDCEGALLFPGPALHDGNGRADLSGLLQLSTSVIF